MNLVNQIFRWFANPEPITVLAARTIIKLPPSPLSNLPRDLPQGIPGSPGFTGPHQRGGHHTHSRFPIGPSTDPRTGSLLYRPPYRTSIGSPYTPHSPYATHGPPVRLPVLPEAPDNLSVRLPQGPMSAPCWHPTHPTPLNFL
jgi:hypothetical protein